MTSRCVLGNPRESWKRGANDIPSQEIISPKRGGAPARGGAITNVPRSDTLTAIVRRAQPAELAHSCAGNGRFRNCRRSRRPTAVRRFPNCPKLDKPLSRMVRPNCCRCHRPLSVRRAVKRSGGLRISLAIRIIVQMSPAVGKTQLVNFCDVYARPASRRSRQMTLGNQRNRGGRSGRDWGLPLLPLS